MKKIYTTIAAVALCVASAFAAQPLTAGKQVFQIGDGAAPSQETVNRHLRAHGAYTYQAAGRLGENTGIHSYTAEQIKAHYDGLGVSTSTVAASKPRKADEQVDLNGNYVAFYMPFFTNYLEQEMSNGLVITMDADYNVQFDGLCGTGVTFGALGGYTDNANLKGVYDPATKVITCPGGQVLAKYSTTSLTLSPADLNQGSFSSGVDITFSVADDGTITCGSDLYLHNVGGASGYDAQIGVVIEKATCMITYSSSIAGEITAPFWYKSTVNDAGESVLRMSGLATYMSTGYTTEWALDGNKATANSVIGYSNATTTASRTYYISTQSGSEFLPTCEIDLSNPDDIVFPADGSNWTLYDESGYWTGRNSQAHLTPVTVVTPPDPEDPDDPEDHGEGTTTSYIDCYKPFFTSWDASKTVTQIVYVTIYEDNYVEIDGLGGIGVKACEGQSGYTDIKNLAGTYDPDTKTITIGAGQVLGKYAGVYDITVFVGSTEGGTSLWQAPMQFTQNAQGQWICSGTINTQAYGVIPADIYYLGATQNGSLAGGLAGQDTPVFNPANGTIAYNWSVGSNSGAIDEPIYYAIVTAGKNKTLRTSNLASRADEGYMVDWAIDETTKTASATDAATYTSSSSGDFILSSSTDGGSTISSTVIADISDVEKITFPVSGIWCTLTASGSYFGLNSPATITGTPVMITEEVAIDPLYMIGEFNNWSKDEPLQMAYDEENDYYSYTLPAATAEFAISTAKGSEFDNNQLSTVDGDKIANNTGEIKYFLTKGTDNILFDYTEGQWTVYVDLNNMQIWATNPMSGVVTILNDENAPAVYYNLQGIKIDKPINGGVYIKRQGNTVSKVLVK